LLTRTSPNTVAPVADSKPVPRGWYVGKISCPLPSSNLLNPREWMIE
jgi:hypothetical protein